MFTVIFIVPFNAHCPVFGVKVYVSVDVLLIEGDHEPKILLLDVVGRACNVPPEQIALT